MREKGPLMPIRGESIEAAPQDITDLLVTLIAIETRLLRLVRAGDREVPVDDVTTELTVLSRDLKRCYRRIGDLAERRDLGFTTQRKVGRLRDQCIWLYRKAVSERAFFRKLVLEAGLRRLISEEAFGIYQEILWVEDEERRLGKDDASVVALLSAESEVPSVPPSA
ncbi:MAG TPA: hypothetical protein VKT83_10850 [bacterium]|nr:hypothetical protein [bacterium]